MADFDAVASRLCVVPLRIEIATTGHTCQLDTPVAPTSPCIRPAMMRQGIAASATEPPYNLATAKALIHTLYIATRKRRRFASLPEVDMGEVDRAELAGVAR